jgi:CHAT domain-containing protein
MSFTGAEGSPPDVQYPKSYLTPYDLAIAPMLSANVVAIFGACVTGQAADKDGGEVSGFLRASVASGAGACLLTYWPVLQSQVDTFVESLTKVLCDDQKSIGDAIQGTQDALTQKDATLWTKACFVCFV